MTTPEGYQRLKDRLDEMTRERDRAAGALAEQVKRLKDEFGCASLKEAKALLNKWKYEAEVAGKAYRKAAAEFERKWKERLGDQ